jgi:hypothetical protein
MEKVSLKERWDDRVGKSHPDRPSLLSHVHLHHRNQPATNTSRLRNKYHASIFCLAYSVLTPFHAHLSSGYEPGRPDLFSSDDIIITKLTGFTPPVLCTFVPFQFGALKCQIRTLCGRIRAVNYTESSRLTHFRVQWTIDRSAAT